jgi:hypothetical protein
MALLMSELVVPKFYRRTCAIMSQLFFQKNDNKTDLSCINICVKPPKGVLYVALYR